MGKVLTHLNFELVSSNDLESFGFDDEFRGNAPVQGKIKRSLDLSLAMLKAVRETLENFLSAWADDPGRAAKDMNINTFEVEQAVYKYFGVPMAVREKYLDTYLKRVRAIARVYRITETGLNKHCVIGIVDDDKVKGRVRFDDFIFPKDSIQSPIRRFFGFQHEWNHRPWRMAIGNIELHYGFLLGNATPDVIARCIVHEATHKFAQTKDILYKHQSFAQLDLDADTKAALVTSVNIPGREKPLVQMSGYDKDAGNNTLASDERMLENADSYAWMARRIWKHATGFKKKKTT